MAGCGSGGEPSSGKDAAASGESLSASLSTTYLVRADTDEINGIVATAQKAGATSQFGKRIEACGAKSGEGYAAWRRCGHGLLDPFHTSLQGVSTTLSDLKARAFPPACKEALEQGAETFTVRARTVSVRDLTRACYSPKDLESINASPSATPTKKP